MLIRTRYPAQASCECFRCQFRFSTQTYDKRMVLFKPIRPVRVVTETPHFGWGLKAERDVHLGEKLAVVPRSRCMGLDAPLTSAAGSDNEDDDGRDDPEDNCWMGPPEVQALVEKIPRMYSDLRQGGVGGCCGCGGVCPPKLVETGRTFCGRDSGCGFAPLLCRGTARATRYGQ